MIRARGLAAVALLLVPVLMACGRAASTSSGPSMATLLKSSLSLADLAPQLDDSQNWWVAAPTFDVRPLRSSTRDDADVGGLTVRFTHVGTQEDLSINYEVWNSTTISKALISVQKIESGNGLTGPKAGDDILYYNRKLMAGSVPYNNLAFVRLGPTLITIIWSHVDGFATTNSVGRIAGKAVSRLKDGLAGKLRPIQSAPINPIFLAPPGPQLTLLGATHLPLEVVPQMLFQSNPTALVTDFQRLGAADFAFGDYALNADTRMEVVTIGLAFTSPTAGDDWLLHYFGSTNEVAKGVYGGYDSGAGQYLYGFGTGSRAVLMICKSSAQGEEAGRSCEAPLGLVIEGWLPLLAR